LQIIFNCYITYGDTLDKTIEKAKEEIELYIESLKACGEELAYKIKK